MPAFSASTDSFPPRYPLRRIVGWLSVASLVCAAMAGWWAGTQGAISGLLGGGINVMAVAAYGTLVRVGDTSTPGASLRTMLRAEAGKIMVILLLLLLVLTAYHSVVHVAFFAAFVITVLLAQVAALIRD